MVINQMSHSVEIEFPINEYPGQDFLDKTESADYLDQGGKTFNKSIKAATHEKEQSVSIESKEKSRTSSFSSYISFDGAEAYQNASVGDPISLGVKPKPQITSASALQEPYIDDSNPFSGDSSSIMKAAGPSDNESLTQLAISLKNSTESNQASRLLENQALISGFPKKESIEQDHSEVHINGEFRLLPAAVKLTDNGPREDLELHKEGAPNFIEEIKTDRTKIDGHSMEPSSPRHQKGLRASISVGESGHPEYVQSQEPQFISNRGATLQSKPTLSGRHETGSPLVVRIPQVELMPYQAQKSTAIPNKEKGYYDFSSNLPIGNLMPMTLNGKPMDAQNKEDNSDEPEASQDESQELIADAIEQSHQQIESIWVESTLTDEGLREEDKSSDESLKRYLEPKLTIEADAKPIKEDLKQPPKPERILSKEESKQSLEQPERFEPSSSKQYRSKIEAVSAKKPSIADHTIIPKRTSKEVETEMSEHFVDASESRPLIHKPNDIRFERAEKRARSSKNSDNQPVNGPILNVSNPDGEQDVLDPIDFYDALNSQISRCSEDIAELGVEVAKSRAIFCCRPKPRDIEIPECKSIRNKLLGVANTQFDPNDPAHRRILSTIWCLYKKKNEGYSHILKNLKAIGFTSESPWNELRSAGMLGLLLIFYLFNNYKIFSALILHEGYELAINCVEASIITITSLRRGDLNSEINRHRQVKPIVLNYFIGIMSLWYNQLKKELERVNWKDDIKLRKELQQVIWKDLTRRASDVRTVLNEAQSRLDNE